MNTLLERAFPYGEDFDKYADELYMTCGTGVGTGAAAIQQYYGSLALGNISPEDARNMTLEFMQKNRNPSVSEAYVSLPTPEPIVIQSRRIGFIGRLVRTGAGIFISGLPN